MYTMLIVDDNPSDRTGVQSLLDWSGLDIEIVGTYANGAKAFTAVSTQKIDIVLTDIAMPIMNGIELAEKIRENHIDTKIVFMSCYNDFEYARSAMDLDIYGYVLKPIIPDDLIKVIKKLLTEYADEETRVVEKNLMVQRIHDMLPMVQEQFLKELLLGSLFNRDEIHNRFRYLQLEIPPLASLYVVSVLVEDFDKQTSHLSVEDKYYRMYSIKDLILSQSTSTIRNFVVQFSGGEYSFLIILEPCPLEERQAAILDIAVGLHTAILNEWKLTTRIGISKNSNDITQVNALYLQSKDAVNTPFYGGINPIIQYELVERGRHTKLDFALNLDELYQQIKDLMLAGDEGGYWEFLNKNFHFKEEMLPETYVRSLTYSIISMTAVVLLEAGSSFKDIFGSETTIWDRILKQKNLPSVQQQLLDLFQKVHNYFTGRNKPGNMKVVEVIKQIIKTRYREQINIEDVAKAVYLSQGYANALFKKETGKSIFDYLLQYRLDKAKVLLMDPDCKVTVVAESVGYDNKSYFSLMFKKYVGMSPSEYKARFAK